MLRTLLSVLWRERDLLEVLGDAYGSERRAVAGGEDSAAALHHRIRRLLAELHAAELERAVLTKALAMGLGDDDYPSLTRLIELCPPSWAAILSEHRDALRTMADRADLLLRRSRIAAVAPDEEVAPQPAPAGALQRSLLDFLA